MEFGKTPFFKEVEFNLPGDKNSLTSFNTDKINHYLGTPQWNQKEWVGRIYPKGLKGAETLEHYAERFNGIELNSTHYALPPKERITTWKEATPEGFKFSPKISQRISHYGLRNIDSELDIFLKTVMGLEEKLGVSFMQLPPDFSLSDFSALRRFIEMLPKDFQLAIEFRNPSFFSYGNLNQNVFDFLYMKNISTVITDTAGRRDVLHSSITTDKAMIRFVGNDHAETDELRLKDWIVKIESWFQQGLRELYFFAHAPDNIYSIDLASKYVKLMNSLDANFTDPLEKPLDEVVQTSLF